MMNKQKLEETARAALSGISGAKVLELSEREGKIVVQIPRDLFLSNEDFGRIHKRLEEFGGRYIEGAKAWEIESKKYS